ncbi:ABC transporter permease [bacterium]|nr:ABC transporter permease [bacterium]MBU3955623.1 ABC transporter permease [bacterium]
MTLQFEIALRYLFSRRKEVFLLLSSIISVTGIAIGAAALLITLSVMNGFHTDLKNKFLSTSSAVTILFPQMFSGVEREAVSAQLMTIKGVTAVAPYLLNQAVFTKRSRSQGVAVKGVDTKLQKNVSTLEKQITKGNYSLKKDDIFIGSELASSYGLDTGDSVFLTVPPRDVSSFSGGRVKELKISGVFTSGMWEYDMNLVYIDIDVMRDLYGMPDEATGMEIAVENSDRAGETASRIREALPVRLWVRTWKETNRTLFAALELEKKTMFIILSLIVMVAIFNIISSLLLQTIEKVRDIGVLKALGADSCFIVKIFVYQGILSGAAGLALGNLIAVTACLLLKKYEFIQIPASVYYMNKLPVIMTFSDFALVNSISIVLIFLASYIPSRLAGRLSPAVILRYE